MTDIRARLADALRKYLISLSHRNFNLDANRVRIHSAGIDVPHLVDVLLSLPGIAIVDTASDIDKVASAIFHAIERDGPFEETADCVKNNFRRQARAALLAAANAAEADQ